MMTFPFFSQIIFFPVLSFIDSLYTGRLPMIFFALAERTGRSVLSSVRYTVDFVRFRISFNVF